MIILALTLAKHGIMAGMGTSPSILHRWNVATAEACEEQSSLGLTFSHMGIILAACWDMMGWCTQTGHTESRTQGGFSCVAVQVLQCWKFSLLSAAVSKK